MRQIIALCLFAVAAATPVITPEYEWYEYEETELCRDSDYAADPCETGQTPLAKGALDGLKMDGESEDKPNQPTTVTFEEDEAFEELKEASRFEGDELTFELIDESGLFHSFVENPLNIKPPPILAGSPIKEILKNRDIIFYKSFNNGSGPFYYAWKQHDRLIDAQSKLKNRGLEDEALVIDGNYSYYLIEPRPKDILQFAYTKYVADEKGYRANVTIISLDLGKTLFPKFSTLDYLHTLVG